MTNYSGAVQRCLSADQSVRGMNSRVPRLGETAATAMGLCLAAALTVPRRDELPRQLLTGNTQAIGIVVDQTPADDAITIRQAEQLAAALLDTARGAAVADARWTKPDRPSPRLTVDRVPLRGCPGLDRRLS
jgi:hypothetical protein